MNFEKIQREIDELLASGAVVTAESHRLMLDVVRAADAVNDKLNDEHLPVTAKEHWPMNDSLTALREHCDG